MFDWEKAKVVEIKKPDLWSGKTAYEQKDLYDVILAYYCWLHIRLDLNSSTTLYTQSLYAFEHWCTRLSVVFSEQNVIINEAYEEFLNVGNVLLSTNLRIICVRTQHFTMI